MVDICCSLLFDALQVIIGGPDAEMSWTSAQNFRHDDWASRQKCRISGSPPASCSSKDQESGSSEPRHTMKPVDPWHPLHGLFSELVGQSLADRGMEAGDLAHAYLVDLLLRFSHSDEVFSVKREG